MSNPFLSYEAPSCSATTQFRRRARKYQPPFGRASRRSFAQQAIAGAIALVDLKAFGTLVQWRDVDAFGLIAPAFVQSLAAAIRDWRLAIDKRERPLVPRVTLAPKG